MSLYFLPQWERAVGSGARYLVSVCWASYRPQAAGMVDVDHTFTCKASAERFARAIARCLPTEKPDGCPLAWVLVSSLATSERVARSGGTCLTYLALDPGAVIVRKHDPLAGYYGAPRTACARGPVDSLV